GEEEGVDALGEIDHVLKGDPQGFVLRAADILEKTLLDVVLGAISHQHGHPVAPSCTRGGCLPADLSSSLLDGVTLIRSPRCFDILAVVQPIPCGNTLARLLHEVYQPTPARRHGSALSIAPA